MTDCKDIRICSLELLKKIKHHKSINKIDEEKIVKLMSIYIDKLIFNITSLCALLSLKMGVKKILDSHIKYLLFYINKYCKSSRFNNKGTNTKSMRGGAFNTAAFFGVDESRHYKTENIGADIMNIDFSNNIARPALGLQMTGGACLILNKIVKMKMKKIFSNFNVKIDDKSLDIIMLKFNDILNDLVEKVNNSKSSELKYSNFKKLIYKNKIMKNDI